MSVDFYDHEKYLPHCGCGHAEGIEKVRRVYDRIYLSILDGEVYEDDHDMDMYDEWRYRCSYCGSESDTIEDILALRPVEHFCADCDTYLQPEERVDEDGEEIENALCQNCLDEKRAEYFISLREWERGL